MIAVNTHEAKTNFSSLLHAVEQELETVVVCRNGHPIAEIHPLSKPKQKGLPAPNKKLAVKLNYDPVETLDDDELPEVCK